MTSLRCLKRDGLRLGPTVLFLFKPGDGPAQSLHQGDFRLPAQQFPRLAYVRLSPLRFIHGHGMPGDSRGWSGKMQDVGRQVIEIGRASRREGVCQYWEYVGGGGALKTKK